MVRMVDETLRWIARRISEVRTIIFPRYCPVCGSRLLAGEEEMCIHCLYSLPYTRDGGKAENPLQRLFYGQVSVEKAHALMYYYSGSDSSKVVWQQKYRNRPQMGKYMGRMMAEEMLGTDFFQGIDAIVPIPLAKGRLRKRGYNQSERLARGVAEVTGLPVWTDLVERVVENPSQTRLTGLERRENVRGIFQSSCPDRARGLHLLMIDDVVTTGSTLISCMRCIQTGASDVRFSVLALALSATVSYIPDKRFEGFGDLA